MKAYTATITKEEFIKELETHQKAGAFVRGTYRRKNPSGRFKGCAIGCSLESISRIKGLELRHDDHSLYETYLGIPEWLARVEDRIFEGLSLEKSKTWPVEFAKAIHVGATLESVKDPFIAAALRSCAETLSSLCPAFEDKKTAGLIEQSQDALKQMIDACESGRRKEKAAALATKAADAAGETAADTTMEPVAKAAEAAAKAAARAAVRGSPWAAAAIVAAAAEAAAWAAAAADRAMNEEARRAAQKAAGASKYDQIAKELLKLLALQK